MIWIELAIMVGLLTAEYVRCRRDGPPAWGQRLLDYKRGRRD